jgi:flagellar basal-body rod protein FlgG
MRALNIAATGMQAQQLNIDNIANNLANVNTTGFKRGRADFQDLLYQTIRPAGASASQSTVVPTGLQVGLGTRSASITKSFTQGSYQQTDQPLDLLIEGDGFFEIQLPNGDSAYTRDGSFKLDDQGRVVTTNGDLLVPGVTIPQDAVLITVGTDGTVSVTAPGQPSSAVGNLTVVRFANPTGLEALGQNLYRETLSSGAPTSSTPGADGAGTLRQGMLEMSNVSVVEELVNMIVGQRAYEINSRAITTADEMMQTASQLKR